MNDKKRYGEELPPEIKKMLEDKNNSKKIEINSKDYNGLEDYKKELESGKVIYEKEMEEKPKKPLEFVIEKDFEDYYMRFYYENKTTFLIQIEELPDGLIVGRHYHIDDLYGQTVIDDRKGL